MIEQIIKIKAKTFRYGAVVTYDSEEQKATVKIGEKIVAVSATMTLTVGGAVVLAQNDQDKSWIIVEASNKALPTQKTLLIV